MKIGIFDSGMGGLSVLYEAMKLLPKEDFIYYGDSKNAPYGIKTKEEVVDLCIDICDYLVSRQVDAIVVACNTATSAAIKILRAKYEIPIIGMEPALKPAVEENHGKSIAVMATEMTLKEDKFNKLMSNYASTMKVYKVPAPKIVELVEAEILDDKLVDQVIEDYFKDIKNDIESVVLGCTHFLFVKKHIQRVLGDQVHIIDGNLGTVKHLMNKLSTYNLKSGKGSLEIINSAGRDKEALSERLLTLLGEHNGN